jgi:FKBP-type peptidyl-prolyl cis-trans isomerase
MKILIVKLCVLGVSAFSPLRTLKISNTSLKASNEDRDIDISRRSIMNGLSAVAATTMFAGILPTVSDAADQKPKEFLDVGTQAPAPEGEPPFVELTNGVKVKDVRPGNGQTVTADSQVMIQASGRLLNLNGVIFYNTKNNNPDGFGAIPLSINLGKGEVLPGLESGIIGMKKGGIRRIIIPADLAYSKFPNLEPKPMNSNDQRALDSVVKNPRRDATILFDVSVERIK